MTVVSSLYCIVLIISEDLVFVTRTQLHFLGPKSDKMAQNQMKTFEGVWAIYY
jgi:hypothetical protein